jgi:hypothetical protein
MRRYLSEDRTLLTYSSSLLNIIAKKNWDSLWSIQSVIITLICLSIKQTYQYNNKTFWKELIAYFAWYDTGHIEHDAFNNSSVVTYVFVTAVTFLPSRCLATIGVFLLSRCLVTIGVFLPSRCLAAIMGLLPSRCLATIRGFLPSRCLETIRGLYRAVA